MSNSMLVLSAVALAVSFSGTAAATDSGAIDTIQPATAHAVERTRGAAQVSFKKLGTRFVNGDSIGTVRTGIECSESAERAWSELIAQRVEIELHDAFRKQLAQSAPATAGQTAPIEVAPFINDLRIDLCGLGRAGWQGEVYVQINWTVSAAAPQRIVYQASTSGVVKQDQPASGSAIQAVRGALASAARELLGDGRLVAVLRQPIESSVLATTR